MRSILEGVLVDVPAPGGDQTVQKARILCPDDARQRQGDNIGPGSGTLRDLPGHVAPELQAHLGESIGSSVTHGARLTSTLKA